MTWFKVDDGLAFHAKVVQVGNAAMGLWVRAGSWSAQQLTNGFVPDHIVTTLGTKGQATSLAAVGLWLRDEGGYRFHGWEDFQPTREEVETKRAEWREKKRKQRRAPSGQFVSPGDTRGESPAESHRPVPSRPVPTSSTYVEGGAYVPNASDTPPPLYSDRCSRHGDAAEPGNCGGCADVRKANERRPLALVREGKRCVVHDEAYTNVCRGCRADEIAAEESA